MVCRGWSTKNVLLKNTLAKAADSGPSSVVRGLLKKAAW